MDIARRSFLVSSLAAASSAAASRSANDRIRVAIVGLRGRGRDLIKSFNEVENQNVEIAAFCDVDQSVMRQRAADFEKDNNLRPVLLDDMRRAMDDKSIDAIAFATPNHWHALGTIWACQAGKDVYCEKPGTHNFWEGLQVQKAAEKYQRIVQHGTQNRSSANVVEAIAKLKEGVIGRALYRPRHHVQSAPANAERRSNGGAGSHHRRDSIGTSGWVLRPWCRIPEGYRRRRERAGICCGITAAVISETRVCTNSTSYAGRSI